jgi:hypothetical protein
MLTAEMRPRGGAPAAQWLGLDTVLPCHDIDPDDDAGHEFMRQLDGAHTR